MSLSSTSDDPTSEIARAQGKTDEDLQEDERVGAWVAEITAARKREEAFRTQGSLLVRIYEGEEGDTIPFNILYSNTETIAPALYNNTPRPVVKPRYRKNDPIPKASADLTAGYLEFWIDTGDADTPTLDNLIVQAVHEALVPGRGLTRFDYASEVESDSSGPKKVKWEYICGDHVTYNRFLHGYAKHWDNVPWVCFEHFLSLEEVKAQKDWEGKLADIPFAAAGKERESEEGAEHEGAEATQLAHIYELWDKGEKKVYFFADGGKQFLSEKKDTYKLTGFYPVPRPMTFVTKINSLTPVALYDMYENQARELNNLTLRIKAIIAAIKAVGFYNPLVEGLAAVLDLEDGQLHPLEGTAALGDNAALQNAVWMWPVEKMIVVLVELMNQREAVKNVIYEIMGISDILRGASVATETATAQNLKNQWGSLRIKRFQKEVARYVRDCLRIVAELAFSKLGKETLFRATGTTLPFDKDWKAAEARVKQVAAAAQQAMMAAPPVPGGPPPPPPPQPDPADLAMLREPTFETITSGLKDDLNRKYLIDIELNSTVDVEATEDKTNLTEFLQAMAQFFGGVGPLVESGTLPWEAAKAMMLTISRKFRLGRDLDDELMAMQKPAQQGGEAAAAMAKVQAMAQKLEKDKMAFAGQQMQAKVKEQAAQSGMKVASLQHQMQIQHTGAQDAMKRLQGEIKDVKTKAALDKIMLELENKHREMVDDAASVAQEIEHAAQIRDLEMEKHIAEVRHEFAEADMERDHDVERATTALESKKKDVQSASQLAAAKKAAKKAPAKGR